MPPRDGAFERHPAALKSADLRDILSRWMFMLPASILLFLVLAYPIGYAILISFAEFDLATFKSVGWVGWDNYEAVMEDARFWRSLRVTAVYLAFALPIQMLLGFGIAHCINVEWKGRGLLRALLIIPMVVAPVVAGGIWRMLLDPLWGLTNYVIGLFGFAPLDWLGNPTLAMATIIIIDTWRWTPFVTLIATAALLSLPRDVFEAAEIDGANWWVKFWSIGLPLLVPVIAATLVVRWLGAVKMFDIALAATNGGPGNATNVVNLYIYEQAFRGLHFAESAAMTVIVLAGTIVLTLGMLWGSKRLEELN
jgi:multiple sugar transport system permease protein